MMDTFCFPWQETWDGDQTRQVNVSSFPRHGKRRLGKCVVVFSNLCQKFDINYLSRKVFMLSKQQSFSLLISSTIRAQETDDNCDGVRSGLGVVNLLYLKCCKKYTVGINQQSCERSGPASSTPGRACRPPRPPRCPGRPDWVSGRPS